MPDPTDPSTRIALARDHLTAKLGELRRREARARTVLSPLRHLANPWLRLGLAAVIGYRLGRPGARPAAAASTPVGSETLVHAVVRAGLVVVAQSIVRRLVAESSSSRETWPLERLPGRQASSGART